MKNWIAREFMNGIHKISCGYLKLELSLLVINVIILTGIEFMLNITSLVRLEEAIDNTNPCLYIHV